MCNGLAGCNPLKKQKRHIPERKKLQDMTLDVNKIMRPFKRKKRNRKQETEKRKGEQG
jgi:hypothetical protein